MRGKLHSAQSAREVVLEWMRTFPKFYCTKEDYESLATFNRSVENRCRALEQRVHVLESLLKEQLAKQEKASGKRK